MTTFIDTAGTISPALINILYPPVTSGCIGYYEFGAVEASSLKNLVNPVAPLTKIGAPAFSSTGVVVSGSAGLSGPADSAQFTRLVVARMVNPLTPASGPSPTFIGNFVSGQGGAFLYAAVTAGNYRPTGFGTSSDTSFTDAAIGSWATFSHRVGATSVKVSNFTRGLSSSATITAYTPPSPARPILFGANNGWLAAVEILSSAVFNRALSDGEETTMQTWMRARALLKGVTA